MASVTSNTVRESLAGERSGRVDLLHDGEEMVAQVGLAAVLGDRAALAYEGAPYIFPVTVTQQHQRNQDGQKQTWRNHLICNNNNM